jgi:hypothetical protein
LDAPLPRLQGRRALSRLMVSRDRYPTLRCPRSFAEIRERAQHSHPRVPALRGEMGVRRGKLPGLVPSSHQDALHEILGQGDAKRQPTEGDSLLSFTIEIRSRCLGFAPGEGEHGAGIIPSDGG